MVAIDFTEVMRDGEAGWLNEQDIYKLVNYWKQKALTEYTNYQNGIKYASKIQALKDMKKGLLILTTYRCGRRISEMIGKSRVRHYVGLRPCDLIPGKSLILFHILKKNHVRLKTPQGKPKSEDKIIREKLDKKPKRAIIAVDKDIYNILIRFIKNHDIHLNERIFPFSRQYCDVLIKEAAEHTGVIVPGTRIIKDKVTKEEFEHKKQVHFHHLRHSFAVHFLEKKKNNPQALIILQGLLCHSSIEVTKAYLRFGQEKEIDVVTSAFAPEHQNDPIETLNQEETEVQKE